MHLTCHYLSPQHFYTFFDYEALAMTGNGSYVNLLVKLVKTLDLISLFLYFRYCMWLESRRTL